MIKTLRMAIATALLLAAGNAAALGLGQIEVKSRLNQPLLAEIPIISTVPGELEVLQARLASPETFRRVGLAPPDALAANLQFSLGSDARGRPVIRVTSTAPVNQAVLNFLIEVDWGQGRLVREYSALVDAPRTASAPVQPAISAPVAATPNVVQRPAGVTAPVVTAPAAPRVPAPVATPPPRAPQPATATMPAPQSPPARTVVEPLPRPTAVMPPPTRTAPRQTPAAPVVARPVAAEYGPVKRGESLSKIASQLPLPVGYTLDQAMLALLRANPDAFLAQDINQLKQGAVLRVPGSAELSSVSADEAALVVREQMKEWRQARRPVAQPEGTPAPPPGKAVVAAVPRPQPEASAPAASTSKAAAPKPVVPAAPRQPAQARLEIVPPSAPGKATGTRSGTSAGGEGTMLQQQLRQRDEDLAARTAEIGELKERVAELEQLRQQQQQLLALKDSELAAAEQRLADARTAPSTTAASKPPPSAQDVGTAQPAATPEPPSQSNAQWLWSGLALFGVLLLAWLLMRRRPHKVEPPRRKFDSDALAASMVVPRLADAPAGSNLSEPVHVPPASAADQSRSDVYTPTPPETHLDPGPPASTARVEAPKWHSGRRVQATPEPAPVAVTPAPSFVPVEEPAVDTPAQASAEQRMKLARAFVDIGDETSAQQLLRELLDDPDPAARSEAARVLRELG